MSDDPSRHSIGGLRAMLITTQSALRNHIKLGEKKDVENAALRERIKELEASLKGLIPILEAVRHTAGLGKNQMQRLDAARQALTPAKEGV